MYAKLLCSMNVTTKFEFNIFEIDVVMSLNGQKHPLHPHNFETFCFWYFIVFSVLVFQKVYYGHFCILSEILIVKQIAIDAHIGTYFYRFSSLTFWPSELGWPNLTFIH